MGFAKDLNNNPILIAAVQHNGVWKKVGSGSWTKLAIASPESGIEIMKLPDPSDPNKSLSTTHVDVIFSSTNKAFYLYDRTSGLWRGDNYGTNWTRIYKSPGDVEGQGFVRVHPTDPKIIFVSDRNGVWRITNADTAAKDAATAVKISGTLANPGAMTLGPNNQLIFVTQPSGSNRPRIYTGDYTQPTPNWTDLSDDYYRAYAIKVITISASTDGTIFVSTNNNSSIVRD